MALVSYLPQGPGWLPTWQLVVAVMAVFNSIQNFSTLKLTRRIYNNVPPATVTALQARTFAAWTITSAVVRGYAAYHLNQKIPVIVSTTSLVWMFSQYDYYVKA
ncbi:Erg28 like protein-domain-containing protein [Mycena metata]|uniref:Erg28 like protein-domain-containing protein n=1 Tax=Mycena metata TaxID=1033252 RepID=A0AAD7JW84_9AGAR|nr:Erg28 like protein-domain-containing protein [Mycena metata]